MEEPREPLTFERVKDFARDHGVSVRFLPFSRTYTCQVPDLVEHRIISDLAGVSDYVVNVVRRRREL